MTLHHLLYIQIVGKAARVNVFLAVAEHLRKEVREFLEKEWP